MSEKSSNTRSKISVISWGSFKLKKLTEPRPRFCKRGYNALPENSSRVRAFIH
jgi:hypothetical protein